MAEVKVKKLWYKRWWAITLFIFIGLSILGNLFDEKETTTKSDINTQTGAQKNTQQKTQETKTTTSGDFCHSIIPERIKLQCNVGPLADHYKNTGRNTCTAESLPQYWMDGTEITGTIWFEDGWRQGENVNYYYPANYLSYEKTPIDSEGNVGEKISYRIMFILDPKDKTEEGYKVKSYKCCQSTKYNPCDILGTPYKTW